MSLSRQTNLFSAEDWKIAYDAFQQIDFQAYDFDTIRFALVEYVRNNFPENFNDYLESSEFIAIIELLAYLAQSLAFRMDVNTRENFLETAERRDSVFKLARMLGYNPKRNIPASGLMKVVSVQTSENIVDSLGTQLNNRPIYWNDANNTQSYEQFLLVMNAAMSTVNRFTSPIKQGVVGGVNTELYQLNTPISAPIAYNFSITTDGTTRPYNAVNPDFIDNEYFYERHPDNTNLFNMIYRNDSKGLASKDTGFFVMFRQGVLASQDFNFEIPQQSRIQEVAVDNINESDVYLQQITSDGLVRFKWEKVANTVGQTLNYNNKTLNTRKLYAVENSGAAGIRLKFGDGNFSDIPQGLFRLWYRASDPVRFTIQPSDARNININIPYVDRKGRNQTLTLSVSLQYAVNNSLPAESLAAIKQRAPDVFYTQNRMVSAQDYNVFPQSQSTNILKLKAINRTHAGHSRYIDLNDPTGTFQNVDTFADDAFLYVDDVTQTEQIIVNTNTTAVEVVNSVIPQRLKQQSINNFVYYGIRNIWTDPTKNGSLSMFKYQENDFIQWNTQPTKSAGTTGFLTEYFTTGERNVLINNTPRTKLFKQNTFLKFVNPDNTAEFKWVRIVDVENGGLLSAGVNVVKGPFTLSDEVRNNWRVEDTIVSLRTLFSFGEVPQIEEQIKERRTFGLGYHLTDDRWYVIPGTSLTSENKTGSYAIDSNQEGPDSWLILMEYEPIDQFRYRYKMTMRGQDYVIQSENDLKFYNVKNVKVVDQTNKSSQDLITISSVNTKPNDTEIFSWDGSGWASDTFGASYVNSGIISNIPLATRGTTWRDIDVIWQSNFGILQRIGSGLEEYANSGNYVNETAIKLSVYKSSPDPTAAANVIVQDNQGTISYLPNKITINFNTETFGYDIVDRSETDGESLVPFIAYRQKPNDNSDEVIFKAPLGGTPVSWGAAGNNEDTGVVGRLWFTAYDLLTGEGTLEYRDIQRHVLHDSIDRTGTSYSDRLIVNYKNNRQNLDRNLDWEVIDVYKETDGYVDPRKIKVAPIDTDDDLVPDDPLEFSEYVGVNDLVLFEYYKDFDGYTYDRPIEGVILDYRDQTSVKIQTNRVSATSYTEFYNLADVDWVLVKEKSTAEGLLVGGTNASGIVVYVENENTVYQILPESTNLNRVSLVETQDFFVKRGRGKTQNTLVAQREKSTIRWQHVAPNDVRIDPSISNIVEMIVLTQSYYNAVVEWKNNRNRVFPLSPTSNELNAEFTQINTYKAASDTIVYRSAKFKMLFGEYADPEYKATFKVVKLSDQISDNELKSRIISIINEYFNVANWEFGETFYFTELSSYIHQRLGSDIGSIVIVPKNISGRFGEMFQVKAEPNELFMSTVTVDDVDLVSRLDNQTLRTDKQSTATTVSRQYVGVENTTGPYAIAGYYPLYSNPQVAEQAGNGTYHTHVFFGQTFYMPNGVPFYHGTYVETTSTETTAAPTTTIITNNTVGGDSY